MQARPGRGVRFESGGGLVVIGGMDRGRRDPHCEPCRRLLSTMSRPRTKRAPATAPSSSCPPGGACVSVSHVQTGRASHSTPRRRGRGHRGDRDPFVTTLRGQAPAQPRPSARVVAVAGSSASDVDRQIVALQRSGALRLSASVEDRLIEGRVHDRFQQYVGEARIWGGEVVRQRSSRGVETVFGQTCTTTCGSMRRRGSRPRRRWHARPPSPDARRSRAGPPSSSSCRWTMARSA